MARKKKKIIKKTDEIVLELAKLGATKTEIAKFLNVDEKTVRNNYSEIYAKGEAELKKTLRQKMIEVAMNGNVVMLIFLAKNYLKMNEEENDFELIIKKKILK